MVIANARAQTMSSFTPMERDLILAGKPVWNICVSFNQVPPSRPVLCTAKYAVKIFLSSRRSQTIEQTGDSSICFAGDSSVAHYLLQRLEVFEIALAARCSNAADRLRAVAVIAANNLHHACLFKNAEVAAEVSIRKRAKLLEIVEGHALR